MTPHVSCGAVVYRRKDGEIEVLLLHRKATNSRHLPKGTKELAETIKQTALREVQEETGLSVELSRYIGKLDSVIERNGERIKKETHYFVAVLAGGDVGGTTSSTMKFVF